MCLAMLLHELLLFLLPLRPENLSLPQARWRAAQWLCQMAHPWFCLVKGKRAIPSGLYLTVATQIFRLSPDKNEASQSAWTQRALGCTQKKPRNPGKSPKKEPNYQDCRMAAGEEEGEKRKEKEEKEDVVWKEEVVFVGLSGLGLVLLACNDLVRLSLLRRVM